MATLKKIACLLVVMALVLAGFCLGYRKGNAEGRVAAAQEEFQVEIENIRRMKAAGTDGDIREYAKMRLYYFSLRLPPGRLGGVADFGPVADTISAKYVRGKAEGGSADDYQRFQEARRRDAGD